MRKRIQILFLIAIFAGTALLPGAENKRRPSPDCRLVTQAQVQFQQGENHLERIYTQPEKISTLLNYLRTADPYGLAKKLPAQESLCQVVLHYSDNSTGFYRQLNGRYFCRNQQPWQKTDSHHGTLLYPLLLLLPGDI